MCHCHCVMCLFLFAAVSVSNQMAYTSLFHCNEVDINIIIYNTMLPCYSLSLIYCSGVIWYVTRTFKTRLVSCKISTESVGHWQSWSCIFTDPFQCSYPTMSVMILKRVRPYKNEQFWVMIIVHILALTTYFFEVTVLIIRKCYNWD